MKNKNNGSLPSGWGNKTGGNNPFGNNAGKARSGFPKNENAEDPFKKEVEPEEELIKQPEAVAEQETVKEPEAVSEEEAVKEPEAAAEEEAVKEPEAAVEEETVSEPEAAVEEEAAEESEVITEEEVVSEPQKVPKNKTRNEYCNYIPNEALDNNDPYNYEKSDDVYTAPGAGESANKTQGYVDKPNEDTVSANNWASKKKVRERENIVQQKDSVSVGERIEKFGKKKMAIIISSCVGGLVLIILFLALTFGYHVWGNHDWIDATCEEPQICIGCGAIGEQALGHIWSEATCESPSSCKRCGMTSGTAMGHKWKQASCEDPRICSVCGSTDGIALGHEWVNSDCTKPQKCSRCGEEKEKVGKHKWKDATCTEPKTCSQCGKTDGKKLGHKWKDANCKSPKTCSRCNKTEGDKGGHVWIPATLYASKTCDICGKTEGTSLNYSFEGYGEVNVTSDGLYFRAAPNMDSEKYALIEDGTRLKLYDCNNPDWYYTEYDGKGGYVYSEYVYYLGISRPTSRTVTSIDNVKCVINQKDVPGYKSSYIVDGGACKKQREALGKGWHVTAKNWCYAYGTYWYEVWDTDDGDYYGWVDGYYLDNV